MEKNILSAREQAYNILCEVCINKVYANLYLRNVKKDINYTTKVVYGTLQHHLYLDYFIGKYTTKLKEKVRVLLLLATYELKFMNSEHYAVINEFVGISKKLYKGAYSKLVNAVLRKVVLDNQIDISDDLMYLSVVTSHPLWLVKMWNKQYGYETTKKICEWNLDEKIQYIRINPLKSNYEEIMSNPVFKENEFGIYCSKGNAALMREYQEGKISIQDISSQEVSQFLNLEIKDEIIDICAAPGSKTLHIAELCKGDVKITALDLYESRINLIQDATSRLGYTCVETVVADARNYSSDKKYDKVLVDAVCSGYGVLKGKSDIKYHMQPKDMDEIILIQRQILENSAKLVKEGGILVYSTCTLNKKENEYQIATFLKHHTEFELIEEKTQFPYKVDGFYMAKLRRK